MGARGSQGAAMVVKEGVPLPCSSTERSYIEDRILALQERKRSIGAAILGGEGEAASALGRDDLDFLFRGDTLM